MTGRRNDAATTQRSWSIGTGSSDQPTPKASSTVKHDATSKPPPPPPPPPPPARPPAIQTRSVSAASTSSGSGHLRAPTELGQFEEGRGASNPKALSATPSISAHPRVLQTRQRARAAVERQLTPAAIQDEREIYQMLSSDRKEEMTLCASFAYRGMEVLVGAARDGSDQQKATAIAYLMCARTKLVFQSLDIPIVDGENPSLSTTAISLRVHAATGQIVLVTTDGHLYSYIPRPSDSRHVNFGRFQWYAGPAASCGQIFYNSSSSVHFGSEGMHISLADEHKVLLAHRDQLAVVDTAPELPAAQMLWTTRLPSPVVTVELSGDAHSIAVVLQQAGSLESQDSADADGVHTLERDWEAESHNNPSAAIRATSSSSSSLGILYKPGPFLVHPAPVTRLSFRGKGRETSQPPNGATDEEDLSSNDLLLTVSQDNTAQIFGQSHWKPLTEWTLAPNTHVDWVAGTAALTLGDMDGGKTSSSTPRKKSSSAASSRRNSDASVDTSNTDSQQHQQQRMAEGLNESLAHRHSHFTSIPTHTTPVSKAGAWICEVCCAQEPNPTIRLSRLTYLKRGADDLSPTLFESVSGYLPSTAAISMFSLSTLTVEGLWPVWNPSIGTDMSASSAEPNASGDDGVANETLRGSAMAFLGLNSGQQVAGEGFFGDPQLIGTQCPPTELRLTMAHAVSGHMTVLEYPLHGDKSLTLLELGRPNQSVLAIPSPGRPNADVANLRATSDSMDHGDGRLVASIENGVSSVVSVLWQQPGTLTMLPSSWHADDVTLGNVTDLLSSTKRIRDESLMPAPLALRPFRLPRVAGNDSVVMVAWWPDDGVVGRPPILLTFTNSGHVFAFEVVTPVVAATAEVDACALPPAGSSREFVRTSESDDELHDEQPSREYEVSIVPDPELGLGLRLESLDDGQPAIAGSFKKNPVTKGILPAEKTGMITLGDELISANDINLEDKTFDEIIATVRELGSSSGPGQPMRLRFRHVATSPLRNRSNSFGSDSVSTASNRRSICGVSPDQKNQKAPSQNGSHERRNLNASRRQAISSQKEEQQVGSFHGIPGISSVLSASAPHRRIALLSGPDSAKTQGVMQSVICCVEGSSLVFTLLLLPVSGKAEDTRSTKLHSFAPTEDVIESVECLDRKGASHFMAVIGRSGQVWLVVATLDFHSEIHSSQSFPISTTARIDKPAFVQLRAHSVQLFATLDTSDRRGALTIWSSHTHPGCELEEPARQGSDYAQKAIREQGPSSSNGEDGARTVDFGFIASGHLDARPWFFVLDTNAATLHHQPLGSDEWIPLTHVSYAQVPSSTLLNSTHDVRWAAAVNMSPIDRYPHLFAMLRTSIPSVDEDCFLLSDWHPESLLANICMSRDGADHILRTRIRELYIWLCSEGSQMQEDQAGSPLLCSSLTSLETEIKDVSEATAETADNVMGALMQVDTKEASELEMIRKFAKLLTDLSSNQSEHSRMELPPVLRSSNAQDLCLLSAIAELLLNPPDYKSIDLPGKLFVTSATLHNVLQTSIESKKQAKSTAAAKFVAPSVLRKEPSTPGLLSDAPGVGLLLSSGACVAALSSNSQENILDWAKKTGPMDWTAARRIRIPFWLRSDKSLARVSEEIGQTIFRAKRDVMECALFFIIARKLRTLRNLAATDQSISGQKFLKFMTTHDFSSERGRRAAEKNAFSLLRKNRYEVAAAFFLLAEPPALQSALETIVTKLNDVDLAFMVARLVESKELASANGLSTGTGFGGGVFGGGGGYAGSGVVSSSSAECDSVRYNKWVPRLGNMTKKLVVERLFKMAGDDNALGAAHLLWMNKREEAAWWLPGSIAQSHATESGFKLVDNLETRVSGALDHGQRTASWALEKANTMIDLSCIPIVHEHIGSSTRARIAGCQHVCSQLIMRGIEIPSLWSLQASENAEITQEPDKAATVAVPNPQDHSSIFDTYDVPSQKPVPKSSPPSIFDSYDLPGVTTTKVAPKPQSSIFDSFDVPNQAVPKAPQAQSSIFDAFDVPGAAVKQNSQSQGGVPQSSIFDDFDMPNSVKSGGQATSGPGSQSPHLNGSGVSNMNGTGSMTNIVETPEVEINLSLKSMDPPEVWRIWQQRIAVDAAARRLVREVASVLASFHGDPPIVTVEDFYLQRHPILPSGASAVLQVRCQADGMFDRVKKSLVELVRLGGMNELDTVKLAVSLVGGSTHHNRLLFSVILYVVIERTDLAESAMRAAACSLILRGRSFALASDDISDRRQTRYQMSSLQMRRLSARLSWQLETCLWLHRSGCFPLSGLAFKEATIAVRLGVMFAGWNRSPDALEAMMRCEPDTIVDEEEGMHLWSSFRQSIQDNSSEKTKKTSSGGWEFFVDCRRSEATKILRESPTGSFIIRPHPNDHGVFTLSFKTNLVPGDGTGVLRDEVQDSALDEGGETDGPAGKPPRPNAKSVKKDDIVQHAIIRLSDSGFRCGSFGPFTSLLDLLESVSESLPFELRFDLPPSNRVIREEGSQPSPNAVLFRKLALGHASSMISNPPNDEAPATRVRDLLRLTMRETQVQPSDRHLCFAVFLDLLVLSKIRRQLSGVAVVRYEDSDEETSGPAAESRCVATWIMNQLLGWCRCLEVRAVVELSPGVTSLWKLLAAKSQSLLDVTEDSVEVTLESQAGAGDSGDSILRSMIQRDSGVDFSTLRLVDGGECSMVVLFSKTEAVEWLVSSGTEHSDVDAAYRLERMERERVIEPVDFSNLPLKQRPADLDDGVRYRFVDPWEVEAVSTREGETRSASLGRQHFLGFSLGKIALACESDFRILGGIPLLELWMSAKGGVMLSRALAALHPPWERASGGDLQVRGGVVAEPEPFANSIRQHLYRNALFQRLELPQRFLALVQVELLDLKNLTSPGGALSLSVYALLRLKRRGSSGVLSNKTRTLDTASTIPMRLGKPTGVGPNAPASWGSVVRFRYPLPDDVAIDGASFDTDREALFKGPPSVLQITVYEKKLLVDHALGTADVDMDGLLAGGQVEEWVPLRSEKHGIHWFTRIRLTLRFELMCLASADHKDLATAAPSVGLQRIEALCQTGGAAAHEDHKRSISSPDLLQYLESMVY